MRALLLLALLLTWPTVSRCASWSCAVQIDRGVLQAAAKAGVTPSWLTALPEPPVSVLPLLAGRPQDGTGSVSRRGFLLRGTGPSPEHPFANWLVLRFDEPADLAAAMRVLAARPEVLAVESIRILHLCAEPLTRATAQSATIPWNVSRIGAPEALAEIAPDSALIVAVIDTGADLQHPDLQSRLWRNDDPPGNGSTADDLNDQNGDGFIEAWERDDDDDNGYVDDTFGYDFTDAPGADGAGDSEVRDADPSDDNGHGTHVAGIIAADGLLRGVAPFVRLMPVRAAYNQVFGAGALETDDAAAAIVYAVDNGARILNLSWGDQEESLLVRAALDYAISHQVLVVAAAGNDGREGPHFPSGDARVIGVSASRADGTGATFSSRGAAAGVEVAAPGEAGPSPQGGILSLVPLELDDDGQRDGYTERRGTSMSAAHVSGVLALVLSRRERPNVRQARAYVVASARRADDADWSPQLGHGEVDALAAVRTTRDLVVNVVGPPRPYTRGQLTLVGTILSGSAIQSSLTLLHPASGVRRTAEVEAPIVADTLLHADFSAQPEGDWEYVLRVQNVEGLVRERHGAFKVDTTPALLDTVALAGGWRGGEPRWLLSLRADEPVRTRLLEPGSGVALLSDAGLARSVQIEAPAPPSTGIAPWTLQLENEAGLVTEQEITPAAALPAWPEANLLTLLDASAFSLTPVWGDSPSGPLIWGVDSLQHPIAIGVVGERLVQRHAVPDVVGQPKGYADVNGDGSPDLLVQAPPERFLWVLTGDGTALPDRVTSGARGRALGLFQLDEDPPFETLVARQDTLLVYDDHFGQPTGVLFTLLNPNRNGFNEWGPTAAYGDFDGDGLAELACGDAEGFVSRFERLQSDGFRLDETIDTAGTYAYELLALPEGALLVGRQQSEKVTGDGFPAALYVFSTFAPGPGATYAFLARENRLRAGSAVGISPATGETWLALVQGEDLYLLGGAAEPRSPVLRLGTAAGEAPVLADLDGDGYLEVALPTPEGSRLYRLIEERRGPGALRAASLGAGALRLDWDGGEAIAFRVRRQQDAGWVDLGTTGETTWVDSTIAPFVDYTYQLDGILPDGSEARSNAVVAHGQPLPRWLQVETWGENGLRLRASNPLHQDALEPRGFVVRSNEGHPWLVDQVSVAEAGRAVDLILQSPLPCGGFVVETQGLRDDQGGVFAPEDASIQGEHPCLLEPLLVVEVGASPDLRGVIVEWSREPDSAADAITSYDLRWDGASVPLDRSERMDATHTLLVLAGATPLVGRGIPYVLRITEPITAREDGAALEGAEMEHRLYISGEGTPRLFPVPNPARGTSVTFAEAAADTWVQIFDLQGQLVRELRGALGGGLTWDLRNRGGERVSSGVYVYVARDGRGTTTGRIAVLH